MSVGIYFSGLYVKIYKIKSGFGQRGGHVFSPNSWPPKPPKYFSVGIFEYILASMPNVYLNV